ncbi:hypothetical protein BCT16_09185 [Vibrio sp. 10N.222.54.B6]|nr:hypothetical protein [Vibrio sp. AIC-3]OCH56348.1 hypothetical protein A6D97_19185 [Vibrio sp. ZF57]OEE98978.1 hypothetical protein A136_20030 [Vibrio crassostreae 9ZC13]PMK09199.1 hypothetical protein BCU07_16125 [Vibrio sp. 10N.261.54.E10]PMK19153.1 hypothetical protein BCU05_16980 [Vibrio sp. 10N.261.54.C3]PML69306.1 hypothetical protein BCT71_01220 [Vibrio sp. 10N.261.51.A7]PMO12182.1 hypothetical protein BCT20_03415 [Vibrio sp. 10N.222.55.C12]PMO15755.1 hypothetical protein BCT17_084
MPTSIGIIGWLDILFNTLILIEISYFPLRVVICDLVSLSTRKRLIINKSRHFDLNQRTEMYDPDHAFINQWTGGNAVTTSLTNQDAL